jgi:hypothetical protein
MNAGRHRVGIFGSFSTTHSFLSVDQSWPKLTIDRMGNDLTFKLAVIVLGLIPVALFLFQMFVR